MCKEWATGARGGGGEAAEMGLCWANMCPGPGQLPGRGGLFLMVLSYMPARLSLSLTRP